MNWNGTSQNKKRNIKATSEWIESNSQTNNCFYLIAFIYVAFLFSWHSSFIAFIDFNTTILKICGPTSCSALAWEVLPATNESQLFLLIYKKLGCTELIFFWKFISLNDIRNAIMYILSTTGMPANDNDENIIMKIHLIVIIIIFVIDCSVLHGELK